jgi:hypothetical protein
MPVKHGDGDTDRRHVETQEMGNGPLDANGGRIGGWTVGENEPTRVAHRTQRIQGKKEYVPLCAIKG